MLIPFGVFSAGVSSGNGGAGAFELISTTILTGTQATVSFNVSAYASTYKHLQLRAVGRSTSAYNLDYLGMKFNSATSYAVHGLSGDGTSVSSFGYTTSTETMMLGGLVTAGNAAANTFAGTVCDILDPFSTTKNKTIRSFAGIASTSNRVTLFSSLYPSTTAVSTIDLVLGSGLFVTGSRFSLYGIKG